MNGQEIELKLAVSAEVLDSPALRACLGTAGSMKSLVSTYHDTPDFALAQAGIALRLRRSDDGLVQTVKDAGTGVSGLFCRGEWETPVTGGGLDLAHLAATGLGPLRDPSLLARLEAVFTTEVRRTLIICEGKAPSGAFTIEVALDRGEIRAGSLSQPLCEVELELKSGTPADLFRLAGRVLEAVPARPLVASKSERGYRLAMGRLLTPSKAKPPPLSHGLTTAEAFQAIARACLDHLLANEACLLATGDGEAIHQMRVALRRLRSAIKLFRPLIAGPELDSVKDGIRWLLSHLGPARDSHVFLTEIIDPVASAHAGAPGLDVLRAHWQTEAETRLAEALTAVESRRAARLILELGRWVETGAWLGSPETARNRRLDAPIAEFALPRLTKAVRKVLADTRESLSRLPPDEQHRIRILCKQVRYGGEFFAPLVPRKQMKVFLAELAELQDVLGQLNDIAVAGPRLSGKGMGGPKAKAAGLVAGWHQARRPALVASADKAWKHWRACPLPWQD